MASINWCGRRSLTRLNPVCEFSLLLSADLTVDVFRGATSARAAADVEAPIEGDFLDAEAPNALEARERNGAAAEVSGEEDDRL